MGDLFSFKWGIGGIMTVAIWNDLLTAKKDKKNLFKLGNQISHFNDITFYKNVFILRLGDFMRG